MAFFKSPSLYLGGLGFLLGVSFSVTLANGEDPLQGGSVVSDIFLPRALEQDLQNFNANSGNGARATSVLHDAMVSVADTIAVPGTARIALPVRASVGDEEAAAIARAAALSPAAGQAPTSTQDQSLPEGAPRTKPDSTKTEQMRQDFGIHLASLSQSNNVDRAISELELAFPMELSGKSFFAVESPSADGKQAFQRIISGQFESADAASAVCAKLKTKGQYCAVVPLMTAQE